MSDINPAGHEYREIRALIHRCSRPVRAAIYRVELARIRPVVCQFFGIDTGLDQAEELLELAMRSGFLDNSRADAVRERTEGVIGALYDADEQGYPMIAAKAVSASLCDLSPRDWDKKEDCPGHLIELAETIQGIEALVRESRWQLSMIRRLFNASDIREAVLVVAAVEPAWMAEFRACNPVPYGFRGPTARSS